MDRHIRLADAEIQSGDYRTGLQRLQVLRDSHPGSIKAQTAYYVRRESLLSGWLAQADRSARSGDLAAALSSYRDVLALVPDEPRAVKGMLELEQSERHKQWHQNARAARDRGEYAEAIRWWRDILEENPGDSEARKQLLGVQAEQQQSLRVPPAMSKRMTTPVSLEFRQVSIQTILEVLSQTSGLNFLLDPDLKGQDKATLFARNTTVEDGLRLLLSTYGLRAKTLNDTTVLIYPGTKEKRQKYEDLVIRTFRLEGADPKQISGLISAFVKSAEIFVNDDARTVTVRDSQENMPLIERLVEGADAPEAEVVLEIRIMEVSTDKLLNLGVQYPSQVRASVSGSTNTAGSVPLREIEDLDRDNFLLKLGDPLAVLNFSQTDSDAKTLANPHIRVRNNQKAKVMIGDKVPVITTTNNTTSTVISESISYLDVGLKLEVEPEIHVDDDVSMTINLEVSDIVKQITTSTGLIAYQIGSRSASTALRLRNGETQALAGLIRDDTKESASRVPGLGNIPVLGHLFSNESNDHVRSELVLLITPHVVRSFPLAQAGETEIMTGPEERPGTPLRLRSGADYTSSSAIAAKRPKAAPVQKEAAPAAAPAPVPTQAPITAPAAEASPSVASPDTRTAPVATGVQDTPVKPEPVRETEEEQPAETAPVTMNDPGLAKVRFSVVAPGQISVGQPFTVAVMGNSQSLVGDLAFSLSVPAGFELIAAASGSGMQLRATPRTDAIVIARAPGGTPQQFNGPLMMITLKATQPMQHEQLRIANILARDEKGVDLLSYEGEPRVISVTP